MSFPSLPLALKPEESNLLKQVICQFSFLNVIDTYTFSYQLTSHAQMKELLTIMSEQIYGGFMIFIKAIWRSQCMLRRNENFSESLRNLIHYYRV